jgi:uncharacterized protein
VKLFSQYRKKAHLRFYEELNDFLPPDKRKHSFAYLFFGSPSIKDVIEALGIPHVEVDLILANGESVDFAYRLCESDNISVYPVFESIDISSVIHLREKPIRLSRFILDVHLGKAAKNLRMLGFDTLYENDLEDTEIILIAEKEKRTILTRDKELLKGGSVSRGYWVRSKKPDRQMAEIIRRFDLQSQIKPFHRCMSCNGEINSVSKEEIESRLEPKTSKYYDEFFICSQCDKIYWKGSHFISMERKIEDWIQAIVD